jgi:hypothetical protein
MRKEFVRLAVMQIILVVYTVVSSAVILKFNYTYVPPPHIFALYVRDWGFLLIFVSGVWCVCAVMKASKPESDHITGINLGFTGVGLVIVYAIVAFVATTSALTYHHQYVVDYIAKEKTPPKPSILNRQLPPDP